MAKDRTTIKVHAKDLVESLTGAGAAVKSLGQAIGKATTAAREFSQALGKVGSVIDRDVRRGAVDELFSSPDIRVGRTSKRTRQDKGRADGFLDEADPRVDTTDQARASRGGGLGISAQEAADALAGVSSAMRDTTAPETGSGAQRATGAATGAKNSEVKEERCKVGDRRLRDEDDSTESE